MLEVFEFGLQFFALLSSASNYDAQEVTISATLLSLNLMALPVATVLAGCILKSPFAVVATTLTVEIIFDKLFTAVAVLLRPDTITELNLSFMGQLARHGGCLIPALMTALDVSDVLVLASHFKQKDMANTGMHRSLNKFTRHPMSKLITVTAAVVSFAVGTVLGVFSLWSFASQDKYCHVSLGPIAVSAIDNRRLTKTTDIECFHVFFLSFSSSFIFVFLALFQACARPRLYYKNGFFQPTSCSWFNTKTLNCGENIMTTNTELPNAKEIYSQMFNLTEINVSNNPFLTNAPKGWGYIPSQTLSITLTNNPQLSTFPYSICAAGNLNKLDVTDSNASKHIDWSNQLLHYLNENVTSTWRAVRLPVSSAIFINTACKSSLNPTLEVLSLANNNLTCTRNNDDCSFVGLSTFTNLRRIDLNDKLYNPTILMQYQTISNLISIFKRTDGEITFVGNKVTKLQLTGWPREETKKWCNQVMRSAGVDHLKNLDLSGSFLSYEDLSTSLLGSAELPLIERIHLGSNHFQSLQGFFKNRNLGSTALAKIKLPFMKLVDVNFEFDEIGSKLQVLVLKENELSYKGIKNAFHNLNHSFVCHGGPGRHQNDLNILSLEKNKLETLGTALVPLVDTCLGSLGLSKNLLTDLNITIHPLPKLLHTLLASNNKLNSVDLTGHTGLRRLDLAGNKLTHLSRSVIPPSSELVLCSKNLLNAIDAQAFANTNVFFLDLSHNKLRTIDFDVFRNMNQSLWKISKRDYYAQWESMQSFESNEISGVFRDPKLHCGINLENNLFNESFKTELRKMFVVEFNFVVGDVDHNRLNHRHNIDFELKL